MARLGLLLFLLSLLGVVVVRGGGPVVPIPRACSTPETSVFPFCNTSLSFDARVKNLISLLNATDKPNLLTARLEYSVPRLGIPEYSWGANCIHGIRALCGTECATVFPNPNALGASFNMSLVYDMAQIIGLELRSLWLQGVQEDDFNDPHVGVDCWSPTINVNRDPRWGRNVEVAGEDPFLLSQYAIQYTQGLQQGKLDSRYYQVVVTLKHWAAYSLENWDGVTRHTFDAIVSPYDWANTYSVAFKAGIDAGARGVMCAYNSVNGVPSCANAFLNDTLRGEWGFTGYVTSDTDAVADIYQTHHYVSTGAEASGLAMNAGTDINSGDTYQYNLLPALNQSLTTMAAIDEALYRTFYLRFQLGLFDPIEDQPYWQVPPTVVNTPETQAFNLFATQQALVLLQNDNVLPFPTGKTIAVLGPLANDSVTPLGNYNGVVCLGGGYNCVTTIYQAIQNANTNGKTVYEQGCGVTSNDTSGFSAAINLAQQSDLVVLVLGLDSSVEAEGLDRVQITLPGVQDPFSQSIIKLGKPTVVVLINGGAIATEYLQTSPAAILEAFYPGFQGGPAIASAIFGNYNPGGKMPYTIYESDYVNQIPLTDMNMTDKPGRTYRYFTGTPLWPFGWGLSYTTFSITWSNTSINLNENTGVEEVTYTVNVTNTGKVDGDEVVQAYFKPQDDPYLIKQLFAFQRVHLSVGQTVSISFTANYLSLQTADEKGTKKNSLDYSIEITNGVDQILETSLRVEPHTHRLFTNF